MDGAEECADVALAVLIGKAQRQIVESREVHYS